MLTLISEWVVKRLIVHRAIAEERRDVYRYGCELIVSTASVALFILLAGLSSGRFASALIFLLYFMPIRTVAGGYHAPSYGKCFVLTSLTAFICAGGGEFCSRTGRVAGIFLWIVYGVAQLFIWLRGPFRSRRHPLREDRIAGNRRRMHRMQILETAVCLSLQAAGREIYLYTAILATTAVAVMIAMAEKEECGNVGSIGGSH